MGSRGFTLEKATPGWDTAGYIDGVKVLRRKGTNNDTLPPFSNTPGTTYVRISDGRFKLLRVYDENRSPRYDIEYGPNHSQGSFLHLHRWRNGKRVERARKLLPRHLLYRKHQQQIEWSGTL